jgi:hypothetical protein
MPPVLLGNYSSGLAPPPSRRSIRMLAYDAWSLLTSGRARASDLEEAGGATPGAPALVGTARSVTGLGQARNAHQLCGN